MGEDDETPLPAGSPASLLQSETPISELASGFIDLRAGEVDGAIQDALRRVRDLLEIDYAAL